VALVAVTPIHAAYLNSAEAASYLRYRGASGIRAAVRRRELIPDGAGPHGTHLFTKETLDSFVRTRARSLGRLVSRPSSEGQTDDKDADEGIVKLGPNKYNIRVRATCPRSGMRKGVERVRECSLLEAHALQLRWQSELKASFLSGSAAPQQRLKDFVPS
jgi:hypothetical protein